MVSRVLLGSGANSAIKSISEADEFCPRAVDPNSDRCAMPACRSSASCSRNRVMTEALFIRELCHRPALNSRPLRCYAHALDPNFMGRSHCKGHSPRGGEYDCAFYYDVVIFPFSPLGKNPPELAPVCPGVAYTICKTWDVVRVKANPAGTAVVAFALPAVAKYPPCVVGPAAARFAAPGSPVRTSSESAAAKGTPN